MTAEQMLIIIFIISFGVGGALTCIISEKVQGIRKRRRRKEAYISHIEKENLQLKRTVNFLRFQAELNCKKGGDSDGSLHTVRER